MLAMIVYVAFIVCCMASAHNEFMGRNFPPPKLPKSFDKSKYRP